MKKARKEVVCYGEKKYQTLLAKIAERMVDFMIINKGNESDYCTVLTYPYEVLKAVSRGESVNCVE